MYSVTPADQRDTPPPPQRPNPSQVDPNRRYSRHSLVSKMEYKHGERSASTALVRAKSTVRVHYPAEHKAAIEQVHDCPHHGPMVFFSLPSASMESKASTRRWISTQRSERKRDANQRVAVGVPVSCPLSGFTMVCVRDPGPPRPAPAAARPRRNRFGSPQPARPPPASYLTRDTATPL